MIFVTPESLLPRPAPLIPRILAFLADTLLIMLGSALLLKILLPVFSGNGLSVFFDTVNQLSAVYAEEATSGNAEVASNAATAIIEKAAQNESLVDLFETAYLIAFIFAVLYFTLTEHFLRGQTLGKRIFGLRTVLFGTSKIPPMFLQTLSRAFWKAATIFFTGILLSLILTINGFVVLFSKRHRGWHDKLARTEVIDARADG